MLAASPNFRLQFGAKVVEATDPVIANVVIGGATGRVQPPAPLELVEAAVTTKKGGSCRRQPEAMDSQHEGVPERGGATSEVVESRQHGGRLQVGTGDGTREKEK
jgi:hypothetical protein